MNAKSRQAEAGKFDEARQLEKDGDVAKAIKVYLAITKKNPLHIDATNRLLILYRKLKDFAAEQQLLKNAIKSYESHAELAQKEWMAAHKKIAEDSRPLAKMLGLLNAKDLPFYEHEVMQKWIKRLDNLEKRMAKMKKQPKKEKIEKD